MSSSWPSRCATVSARFGTWAWPFPAPGNSCRSVWTIRIRCHTTRVAEGFCMIELKTIAAGATIAGALGVTALGMGLGVANAAPLPPSPQGRRGHKINPTATDMDTTETGTAGTGAAGTGTAGPGGTRGSTRASAPPVRSATSPAACASSRGSCRRSSVAALRRWGGDPSAAAARTASTRICAVEAHLAHLSDPETT